MAIAAAAIHPAVEGCILAIRRCLELVDLVGPDGYMASVPGQGSVGAHLRHCLDHFACLFRGLECGAVDYDQRERDPLLEQDPERFREVAEHLLGRLLAMDEFEVELPVAVRMSASLGREPVTVASSVERELGFLSGHTIHHLTIMILIARVNGFQAPTDLGVAYSTAAYRAEQAARG
ncbi:MAG: hypothetical protein GHCLOJNM_02931 [bacterium]|nr:hypothetical protein [bacterium]